MKKLSIVLLSIFVAALAAEAKPKKAKEEKKTAPKLELTSDVDSASYAMGVYMGTQSARQLSSQDFNIDLFVKAFVDAVYDAPLKMSPDSAVMFLNAYEKKVRPCFVWKGFRTFPAHLRMRPVSRGNSRRSLVV